MKCVLHKFFYFTCSIHRDKNNMIKTKVLQYRTGGTAGNINPAMHSYSRTTVLYLSEELLFYLLEEFPINPQISAPTRGIPN